MVSQSCTASATVSKGDPPTLMRPVDMDGAPRSYKAGPPVKPRTTATLLLITNEKPRSLALQISNSAVAGPTRLKCGAI